MAARIRYDEGTVDAILKANRYSNGRGGQFALLSHQSLGRCTD
jgi:hypothetical protein